MGILERLFGNSGSKPVPVDTIHPIFGSIYMDTDSSWFAETSDPFGCKGNPSLSIDGDDTGPFLASVDTFRQLRDNWTSIASTIAETLLELNHNYFSDNPDKQLETADGIWDTAELLSVSVGPDGNASLTYIFDWQLPGDDHQITVYLEKWNPTGTSIDG